MFSLAAAADRFRDELFYPWDPDLEDFDSSLLAQFSGRVFRLDRFTTIYHRPTRRRQLAFASDQVLPASKVVKHVSSGDVYILSNTEKKEEAGGTIYDRIVAGNLANAPSGGLGYLYRPTIEGGIDDPGAASFVLVSSVYLDTELRSVSAEDGTEGVEVGQYFVTMPANSGAVDSDWIVFAGDYYKLVEPYFDSGFLMARAIREPYDLVPITYYIMSDLGGGYDPESGTVTQRNTSAKTISAIVKVRRESSAVGVQEGWSGVVYIDTALITWNPEVGHSLEHAGIPYKITEVSLNKTKVQWELKVSQWQAM